MLVFWGRQPLQLPWVEPDGLWDEIGYPHLQKQRAHQYILNDNLGRDLYD